jgi:hypothetical protein
MVSKLGPMVPFTKATGKIIMHTDSGNSNIKMAITTKANGNSPKQMARASMCIKVGQAIMVYGKMIFSMGMGWRTGRMAVITRAITTKVKKKGWVSTNGQMVPTTPANGWIIIYLVKAHIYGLTEEHTSETGLKITCKAMDATHGPTVESMKGNTTKIKNMATEYTNGYYKI